MTAALEGDEWSAARPGRTLTPGKTRYPFYRRLVGPQGRSGRTEKSRPHRDSIPDRPARSRSLYRLSYPAHIYIYIYANMCFIDQKYIKIKHKKDGIFLLPVQGPSFRRFEDSYFWNTFPLIA